MDIDAGRIALLNSGQVQIYEPGLHDMLEECIHAHRISFAVDATSALRGAEACFICVGTPMSHDGQANLTYVESVARTFGANMDDFKVVVTKSTVPVGTTEKARSWINEGLAKRNV